jgi:hypothetical protein
MKERSSNINYNSSQTYKVYLKSKTNTYIGISKGKEGKIGTEKSLHS